MGNEEEFIESLKDKGVTCARLRSIEERESKEAGEFRKLGFSRLAEAQDNTARAVKSLRQRVCKLQ